MNAQALQTAVDGNLWTCACGARCDESGWPRHGHSTVRSLLAGLLVLPAALLLAACNSKSSELRWTEDVRLPDGRVVTLTRYQEFMGAHELGESPSATDYWFEFRHPDTRAVVRWQSDRDLDTLALMMDGGVPVLLASPQFGSSKFRYECPNPPYLLY